MAPIRLVQSSLTSLLGLVTSDPIRMGSLGFTLSISQRSGGGYSCGMLLDKELIVCNQPEGVALVTLTK